ncbi:hypothetical protein, partial [Pseudomonas moraviensis]|uniref:hypothetical protein n=2 Tax=Pseudomonas TaxID=286 RepID=UPI000F9B7A3E
LIVEWGGFAAGSCAALLFCGSEPARDGGLTADLFLEVAPIQLWERACSRKRPDSRPVSEEVRGQIVGVSLLAMAA